MKEIAASSLLTDLYQLNMTLAYLERGETKTAVFEFFVRKLPERRGFLVASGLEQALDYLEALRLYPAEIEWLEQTGQFKKRHLESLAELRFTGDVHAMPEGTVFFPNEPILRVTAPLHEAQLVETRLINLLHFQTLIASKAARLRLSAPDKTLVDFGLRRAHGAEAGLLAARASYIAGFDGTATVLANKMFNIPIYGTMAHSFIEAFDDEVTAFEAFAYSYPKNLVLLIDTYDTEAAAHKVVTLAPKLEADGIAIRAVRLDSGDLIALSKSVRKILDEGGLNDVAIFASGGLDEDELIHIAREKAPIDGFGVGTNLTTSYDAPALDCAYKLQEYAGIARRKQSEGKATWPGRKQVWRQYGSDGKMTGDVLSLETDSHPGQRLISLVMHRGKRVEPQPRMDEIRERTKRELDRLPNGLRGLVPERPYEVHIGDTLRQLASEVDQRIEGTMRTER